MKKIIMSAVALTALLGCESVSKVHDPDTGLTFTTFRDVHAIHAQSIGWAFHDREGQRVAVGASTERAVLPNFAAQVIGAGLVGWGLSGIETTVEVPPITIPGVGP